MSGSSKYTDEFKMKVATATQEEGSTLKSVGEKFGVNPTLVRNWRIKFLNKEGSSKKETNLVDPSKIKEALEDLEYEIEDYLYSEGSEFSVKGFTSLIMSCSKENKKVSIELDLLTECGDKVKVNDKWEWVYCGDFDEDYCLSGIMKEYSKTFSEILQSFNLKITDVRKSK